MIWVTVRFSLRRSLNSSILLLGCLCLCRSLCLLRGGCPGICGFVGNLLGNDKAGSGIRSLVGRIDCPVGSVYVMLQLRTPPQKNTQTHFAKTLPNNTNIT